jgi:hypothetical protein
MVKKEDEISYEDKIAKILKVRGEIEHAWRVGNISLFTFSDLSDILDEYANMIEERI